MTRSRALGSTIAMGALVLASFGVFAGVANAAPAPPGNFGACVARGGVDPTTTTEGPANDRSFTRSGRVTGALRGAIQSNGNSRFDGSQSCFN